MKGKVSFIAASKFESVQFLSSTIRMIGGSFAPRFGTQEARDAVVEAMAAHQNQVENGEFDKTPIMVFPEGTTQNNTHLCQFKRGAFTTRTTITPVFIHFDCRQITPFNEVLYDIDAIFFTACNLLPTTVTAHVLPPFKPTDYLFETHKDKGSEEWMVQSWAIRAAISKYTGVPTLDQSQKEHFQYYNYLVGKADSYLLPPSQP